MSMVSFLYPVLTAGAKMLGSAAATEFAKGAGKTAFESLLGRLKSEHGADSIDLVRQVAEKPAYEAAIKADLSAESIAQDAEIKALADAILVAMEAEPASVRADAAIDVGEIRARGNQVFRDVDGIRADRIEADGDQTFEGIRRGK
ncbi:MAG: hypothetical protein AAF919_19110 [Pseudomonadota bacterium]